MLEADVEVDRREFTVRARLTVAPGERLALFGPSGAGKTTLLEVIAGLVAPRRARITLAGRVLTSTGKPVTTVPPWQRRVGLLRQDPGLFPHLSVRDNLRYGTSGRAYRAARASGATQAAGAAQAAGAGGADPGAGWADPGELAELADALGIGGLLAAMPARLSGGQAHRVALGRLLLAHCDALLLDEPYTGLDATLRRTLTDLVISLVAQRGVPAVLVAHELAEAQAFADRLAVLDRGQVLQTGPPSEVVLRPAARRVAELVGYAGFVPAPAGTAPAGTAAGIHPDRVIGGRHPDQGLVLAGVVAACRPAGALWEITLRAVGATLVARLPEPAPPGQELVLTVVDPPYFGPDGAAVGPDGAAAGPDGAAVAAAERATAQEAGRAGVPR